MSNSIKIHIMHCGAAWVDKALLYQLPNWNPIAFTGFLRSKKHRVRLPLTSYLIEVGDKKVLVDTGWSSLVKTRPIKALGFMQAMLSKIELPQGKSLVEQLDTKGIKAADIDYLILTHLHGDHISGLKSVAAAKNIMVSDIEMHTAKRNPIIYYAPMWRGVNLNTFSFVPSSIGPEQLSFNLLGDGRIQLVAIPGHTAGQAAIMIQNNDSFIILCADAAYNSKSWNEMLLPGITTNKKQARRSLEWIAKMSRSENCKGIFASHDSSIAEQIIEL